MNKDVIKCPYCGSNTEKNNNLKCENCNYDLKESFFLDEKAIEYQCFLLDIEANNMTNIMRYSPKGEYENKITYQYYLHLRKKQLPLFILKRDFTNDKEAMIILRQMVLRNHLNQNKEKLLKTIENIKVEEDKKAILIKMISENDEENINLYNDLIKEKIECRDLPAKKEKNRDWIILLSMSIAAFLLINGGILLFAGKDFKYPLTNILGFLPTILFTVTIRSILKNKNMAKTILLFILILYIITFIPTLLYRETNFFAGFFEHLKKMLTSITDILDGINKGA